MAQELLTIKDFQNGIAPSPHIGFGDMRNVDIKSKPGIAAINFKTVQGSPSNVASQTFTADASTDIITVGTPLTAARAVTMTSTGTLPAPLVSGTTYYTISAGVTTKLATSLANAEAATAINITDAGTGTHSIVTVNMGPVYWQAKDPSSGNYFALDGNGRLWTSRATTATSWYFLEGNTTKGTGNGLVIWKNYVLVFSATGVSAWGSLTAAFASQGWTNAGAPFDTSLTSASWHSSLAGQDDIVYYCNDRYVGSIQENGTFVGTAATATFNQQALDLPSSYKTRCLAELGVNLLIGTSNGINENTIKLADIFPWDRVSSSFDLPIKLGEFGVKSMLTKGNVTYILAGVEGKLYRTNGTDVKLVKQIPLQLTGLLDNITANLTLNLFPQSLADHRGRIFMGIGGSNGSVNSKASGVWSYDPNDETLVFENVISTNSYGGETNPTLGVKITSVFSGDNVVLTTGWDDAANSTQYGIDYLNSIARYDSSQAYIDSAQMVVGTPQSPRTFTDIEVELDKPLAAGQSVVIQFRYGIEDSWTTLATFNTTSQQSFQGDAGAIANATSLQVRAILDAFLDTNTTPELKEIRLK